MFRVLGIMKFTVRKSSPRRNNNDNVKIEVTKNHPNKYLKFKPFFAEAQTHFKDKDNTEENVDEKDLKTREKEN